ncbi:hypothetical protein QFZ84_005551 [Pseudomonas fluorescens]
MPHPLPLKTAGLTLTYLSVSICREFPTPSLVTI